MQIDLGRYDELVHRIYDAAMQPEKWPSTVSEICGQFEATRGQLFTYAHSPAQGGFTFTHNISQASVEFWATKSVVEDPFAKVAAARGQLTEGLVHIDVDLVSIEDLLKTDFYKELMAPMDIARLCSGVVFDATDSHKLPTAMALYRSLQGRPFIRSDADTLRRLLAHLSRSLGVMFHLRDSRLQLAASFAALDRLNSGVMLLDAERRVQFANTKAQAIFAQGDTVLMGAAESAAPLQMRLHHRLSFREGHFQQAITQALQPLVQDAAAHFSQALLLPGEQGQPGCVVHVAPLAESHHFATGGAMPKAIVFLYDLQNAASVQPELLCKLFDMTLAEARAALQVTQGGSLDDMAARLGVSINTLKTQLQAAYTKSGTHRQADLLKLLLSLASR